MPYIATIEILIDVETDAEACDAIAETMRSQMKAEAPTSCLLDWQWAQSISHASLEPCHPIPPDFCPDDPWPYT